MAERFLTHMEWTGANQGPTGDRARFSRDMELSAAGIRFPMSSAPAYHGDASRANPEQLFVAALSTCQALTYLFLAAKNGVDVIGYSDDAEGTLDVVDGKVRMAHVTLRPRITLASGGDEQRARALVTKAHQGCFIANSVSTPVDLEPTIVVAATQREFAPQEQ
jgi:organic hydroperoxide reductase OsmC/OhrA